MKRLILASSESSSVNLSELEKHIYDKLHELSLYYDDLSVEKDGDEIVIKVTVNDGDWKHEHRRLDYLMQDIIYEYDRELANRMYKENEVVTQEDGSDTYSSVHVYCI